MFVKFKCDPEYVTTIKQPFIIETATAAASVGFIDLFMPRPELVDTYHVLKKSEAYAFSVLIRVALLNN